ncbi:MAG: DNRLRE domain-containing protein [Bacteroidales bacterium]|nr:DNRLRE domain-containing protein [Bacteroidales bacterium]
MKKISGFLPLLIGLFIMAGLGSCEKKASDVTVTGRLEIGLALPSDYSTLKSSQNDSLNVGDSIIFTSFQVMVSISDMNGNNFMEDKLIPIYQFGDGFISDKIDLPAGDYSLKKFMVINNSGEVIYAAPLEGSPRAYLVYQPLPLFFTIRPNEITKVGPEVLPVRGFTPSDFGYASFYVKIVKPLTFYVMAMLDNPLLMRPSMLVPADLYFSTPEGWFYNARIEAKVNKLELRYSDFYDLVVYTEYSSGTPEIPIHLSAKEVMASSENNPYVIKIGTPSYQTLVLQPGPEDGIDARITDLEPDKNFGDYKYLEAGFKTEPILTVMRTTESLISFNLGMLPKSARIESVNLSLYYQYDMPVDDSIYYVNAAGDVWYPWSGLVLQQIVEPWKEYGVTWNTKPKTIDFNQVNISPPIYNANYINIDVTRLFVQDPNTDMAHYPNYGMMLKFYPPEVPVAVPGILFASSDYEIKEMRPKLTIKYSLY